MPLNPFDLTGGPFLLLYGVLLLLATIAAFRIPQWLRADGRAGQSLDADHLAYLSGGPARYVDTLVARLLTSDRLTLTGGHKLMSQGAGRGQTAAEMSVLALPGEVEWSVIARAAIDYAEPVHRDLVRRHLLIDEDKALLLRLWQTLPFAAMLLFGAIKWEVGTMRDRPVGFLTVLLVLTFIFAIIRFASVDRRTWAGIAALEDARSSADRLRRAAVSAEIPLAVALFGTTVLIGSYWSDYHDLRRASSHDGGSNSSDSSSGGGCGGGGCGGCGGGGD
jgi:uncharacterized protein (TIGR04222 family)